MEVGDIVKVVNANHPFAGCEVSITEISDGGKVRGEVTKATGEIEVETFEAAELSSDMDTDVVANEDFPRRDTEMEAEAKANTPPTDGAPANS